MPPSELPQLGEPSAPPRDGLVCSQFVQILGREDGCVLSTVLCRKPDSLETRGMVLMEGWVTDSPAITHGRSVHRRLLLSA